ncbi:MAG: DivIVA domain-containing protein [Firmicutes bacterium]|nr:DivIVA domain-containing protein [Bacillota bacterium]MBQ1401070.1 DivIVA domain-containing protein [Bacillota bacterium]MDO4859544.1 DivIVA domain-containing protein [Bacillota bacterium]
MITPYDIQEKEFSRAVRGYKEDEVDAFLDKIIIEMEHLIKENESLKATISDLEGQLTEKSSSDSSVADTLKQAQDLMKEISFSAEKRARLMIKDAELDASNIRKEARQKASEIEEENATLRRNFDAFKNRYRNLLESELERFDTLTSEIYPDLTINDLEDLEPQIPEAEPKIREKAKGADTMMNRPAAKPARKADMDQTMVFGKKD